MPNQHKYMSLFCGCGGFDLGMQQSGFRCIAAYDINRQAIEVFNQNLVNVAVERDLNSRFEFAGETPDVIVSGAPCQGFSTAGKRKLNDPRNSLFLRAIDIALKVNPKVFISENVSGILSGNHKTEYVDRAINMLNAAGYETVLKKIDCRRLGMAQMRNRVFLIAWNSRKSPVFPLKNCVSKSLHEAIAQIPSNAMNHEINGCVATGVHEKIARHISPGQKLSNVRGGIRSVHTWNIPEVFGFTSHREKKILEAVLKIRRQLRVRDWGDADPVPIVELARYLEFDPSTEVTSLLDKKYLRQIDPDRIDLTNTFNGKYRRLRWDEPSLTVDTRFGSPTLFLHPIQNRAYTVREAARIQGFPDDFTFSGSLQAQYEMVGNAVPPPLGGFVADIVRSLC